MWPVVEFTVLLLAIRGNPVIRWLGLDSNVTAAELVRARERRRVFCYETSKIQSLDQPSHSIELKLHPFCDFRPTISGGSRLPLVIYRKMR